MKRIAALALASLVHCAQSGCSSRPAWPDLPPPPSEETRAGLGSVAVRAVECPLDDDLAPPLHGFCSSTAYHTLAGAGVGILLAGEALGGVAKGGGNSGIGVAILLFIAVSIALALVAGGIVIGSLYGAIDSIK